MRFFGRIRANYGLVGVLIVMSALMVGQMALSQQFVDGFEREELGESWSTCGASANNTALALCDNADPNIRGWSIVASGECFEGSSCARAGLTNADDGEASSLEITINVPEGISGEDRVVSFYRRVSSESGFDGLIFFIDGSAVDIWTGARDWAQETYPIGTGEVFLQWIYVKDGSIDVGEDTAWIDNVQLPVPFASTRGSSRAQLVDEVVLTPGTAELGSVEAGSFTRGLIDVEVEEEVFEEREVSRQFSIEIPAEGPEYLAVHLQSDSGQNLDLYGRQDLIIESPPEIQRVRSDFAAISSGGEEIILISNPTPNSKYWFAVENLDPESDQTFQITAWILPEIEDAGSGVVGQDGSIGAPANLPPALARALETSRGELSLEQYRIEVPADALQLFIELDGEGDLNLHLRFGELIGISDETGQVMADISSVTPGGKQSILLSGNLLQSGTYYVAIEGHEPPQEFNLRVQMKTESGDEPIMERASRLCDGSSIDEFCDKTKEKALTESR